MRHLLNFLLRLGRSDADRVALLGDLEEEHRARLARGSGRLSAFAWYTNEIIFAFWCAVWDRARSTQHLAPSTLLVDVRYALRRWRHRPGFAATAILTLGLGIAAATSIFSVVDAVLLKPLPWTKPESIVVVHGVYPERRNNPATAPTWNRWYLSYPDWHALQTASSFESVSAWRSDSWADTTLGDQDAEIVMPLEVSSNFLPMLGVKLVLGRHFGAMEDAGPSDSIILTDEVWRRRFGGRPDIIGERVTWKVARFNEQTQKTVVGVTAPGFRFNGIQPDVFRPIPLRQFREGGGTSTSTSRTPFIRIVARLAPGVSLLSAEAQAAALVAAPPNDDQRTARLVSLEDEQVGSSRRPLLLLFGGTGILLLLACSNVAGLLLGEARVRRLELAVRAALGGSRVRVLRQLVVEHAMIAIAGSAIGLLGAYWFTGALVAMAPAGMPRIDATSVDLRATTFALGTGLATLLIFGVMPAVVLARTPVASVLAEGGRDGNSGRAAGQRLIVVAQVALALVLLTGATLFGETMLRLRGLPLGFDPQGVAVVATTFTGDKWGDPAVVQAAWKAAGPRANPGLVLGPLQLATTTARTDRVLERLSALPGVMHAAGTSAVPFLSSPERGQIALEGREPGEQLEALWQTVTANYFTTMSIPLVSGRGFDSSDVAGTYSVVVSAEFERRFFPEGAIGRRFSGGARFDPSNALRIVGVVPSVKRQDPTDDDRPIYYFYDRQAGTPDHFLIRSSGDPAFLLPAVRQALASVSTQIAVTSMTTMDSRVGLSIAEERFRATLSGIFGAAALVLAAVGLYGLAARRVADRRREFGVRVALGARPGDVRRLVLRDALLIVAAGLAVGLPCSFAIAQITRGLLFGVSSTTPHVFVLAVLLLAVVVMLATILPARKAGRVDPVGALRGT
jgi:hypothetical protein